MFTTAFAAIGTITAVGVLVLMAASSALTDLGEPRRERHAMSEPRP